MAKFSNIKIGQEVWSVQYGRRSVDEFARTEGHKVFQVKFDNGDFEWYFENGKVNIDDANPTLFWNEFCIPNEDDDIKPFNLVEYLKENLQPKKFVCGEYNYYYYDSKFKTWSTDYDEICQDIKTYFDDDDDYLVDMLNKNQITPQQLKNAFKELRWL